MAPAARSSTDIADVCCIVAIDVDQVKDHSKVGRGYSERAGLFRKGGAIPNGRGYSERAGLFRIGYSADRIVNKWKQNSGLVSTCIGASGFVLFRHVSILVVQLKLDCETSSPTLGIALPCLIYLATFPLRLTHNGVTINLAIGTPHSHIYLDRRRGRIDRLITWTFVVF